MAKIELLDIAHTYEPEADDPGYALKAAKSGLGQRRHLCPVGTFRMRQDHHA